MAIPSFLSWRLSLICDEIINRVVAPIEPHNVATDKFPSSSGFQLTINQNFPTLDEQFCLPTGAGKTYTAVTESYRLLRHGGFHRVLFLVDRNRLGDQTLAEFQNYRTPDDGRRFTELYNVDKLTRAGMLASSNVVISTPSISRFVTTSPGSWACA